MKLKTLIQKFVNKETITYLVFGVLTTVVNFAVLWVLVDFWGAKSGLKESNTFVLISNAVAFVVSVAFAYVTNKLFVFESKSWSPKVLKKEIPSFVGARVATFAIEELGIFAVTLLQWDTKVFFHISGLMWAKVALAVIVVILNYIFSKFFIFKSKKEGQTGNEKK